MPKPRKDETEDEYIERCMEDDKMKEDYSDDMQRLAVCYQIYKEEK